MLDTVVGRSEHQFRALEREVKLDGLAEKRVEEGRQMALAAVQAQHQERIRLAVEKYMKWPGNDAPSMAVPLAQAQGAYEQF